MLCEPLVALRSTTSSMSLWSSDFVRPDITAPSSAPPRFVRGFRPAPPPRPPLRVLLLHRFASRSSVLLSVSLFGPSAPTPTMASADFCPRIEGPCDPFSLTGTLADLPGYCAPTFTLMRVGYTSPRSVHVSGLAFFCLLTPRCRLYPLPVRRASALLPASFRPPVARDAVAFR